MKFALDGHAAEDWAGPPDHSTGYIYPTVAIAEHAADQWMRTQIRRGVDAGNVGCYVRSDEQTEGEDPVVDDLYVIHDGRLINRGNGR